MISKLQRVGERIHVQVLTQSGLLKWTGLVAEFETKFGITAPDLPDGYREHYYEPGRVRRYHTGRRADPVPGDPTWPEGDAILAAVAEHLEANPEPEPDPMPRPKPEDDDALEAGLEALIELHQLGPLNEAAATVEEVARQVNLLRLASGLSRPEIPSTIHDELAEIRERRRNRGGG